MDYRASRIDHLRQSAIRSAAVVVVVFGLQGHPSADAPLPAQADNAARPSTIEDAQRFFYNGEYEKAAALTQTLCTARLDDLEACELRSASLLFQIKRAFGEVEERDKSAAWKRCTQCPALMSAFLEETTRGQKFARERLKANDDDGDALFFLGKVDLNYVWLQLGTLGRKTGWNEYWEARKSLDRVLRKNPTHARARVARAWVDYIVGTTVPPGARWLLGGGNKKRGLLIVREVVEKADSNFFAHTEARFALWDMQVRERQIAGAVATARLLARDFPANRELRKFLAIHDATSVAANPPDRLP